MTGQPRISQRDLRLRSKEIMDAVEGGQFYTVTRDGRQIGELIPMRLRRTYVPRAEFLAHGDDAPVDLDRWRAELDETSDAAVDDAYER